MKEEQAELQLLIPQVKRGDLVIGETLSLVVTPQGIRDIDQLRLNEAQLIAALGQMRVVRDRWHVLMADYLYISNRTFGRERTTEIIAQMHFNYGDILHAEAIMEVAPAVRHQLSSLCGEHFVALYQGAEEHKVPAAEREEFYLKWGRVAEAHNLAPHELKKSVFAQKIITSERQRSLMGRDTGIRTVQGISMAIRQWERQAAGWRDWDTERLIELREEAAPIVEFAMELEEEIERRQETREETKEEPKQEKKPGQPAKK